MDFIFISMPYARFISKWFANIPNINLGIMQAYLTEKGRSVKTFHFHLDFLHYLRSLSPRFEENLLKITEQFGVEYMGLDYIFASLLFEDNYMKSKDRFRERLESFGLHLNDFEELRGAAGTFIESAFARLSPYLGGTKLVGFSCSHYQLSSSLLMCSRIKSLYPETFTVVGGKDCSGAFGTDLLKNVGCLDFVGTGECEVTLESLLAHIDDRRKDIYNVLYRDNGEIRESQSKSNLPINSLPFPEYDFEDFPLEPGEIILPVEFGRGCPWKKCTFCPDESYNILCQAKTAERIKAEFEHYRSVSEGLRNFFILDSDALKNPKVIMDISRFLAGRNLNFHYAEFRAEKMTKDVLDSIRHFGRWISNFQIGIETFSDRILKLMNKGVPALKNVEVLKAAAELGVPVQFNLFTCFPNMTEEDMIENFRVMDLITHILVSENILIYPGEFYLPADCPVFLNAATYGIKRYDECIFSLIFEGFAMPSYSNYPYPYQFDNDDEQFRISGMIRRKVEEIKSESPADNYMLYQDSSDGLRIEINRGGNRTGLTLNPREREIYMYALEESRQIEKLPSELGLPLEVVSSVLNDFEQKGIILFSSDRKSFLSLAIESKKSSL
jgi:hypothetical protein